MVCLPFSSHLLDGQRPEDSVYLWPGSVLRGSRWANACLPAALGLDSEEAAPPAALSRQGRVHRGLARSKRGAATDTVSQETVLEPENRSPAQGLQVSRAPYSLQVSLSFSQVYKIREQDEIS